MRRLARISVWVLAFVVFVVVAQWSSLVAMLGFYAVVIAVTAVKTRRWQQCSLERARLLDDAHRQHWALCHGDMRTGLFGRYPVAGLDPGPQEGAERYEVHTICACGNCRPQFSPPWLIVTEDESGLTETRVIT